jgi:hypothetical protein
MAYGEEYIPCSLRLDLNLNIDLTLNPFSLPFSLGFNVKECLEFYNSINEYVCHARVRAAGGEVVDVAFIAQNWQKLKPSLDYFLFTEDLQQLALKCLVGTSLYPKKECRDFLCRLFLFVGFFGPMEIFLKEVTQFDDIILYILFLEGNEVPLFSTCLTRDSCEETKRSQAWRGKYGKFLQKNFLFEAREEGAKLQCVLKGWITRWRFLWGHLQKFISTRIDDFKNHLKLRKLRMVECFDFACHLLQL